MRSSRLKNIKFPFSSVQSYIDGGSRWSRQRRKSVSLERGNLDINAGDDAAVNVEFMFPPPTYRTVESPMAEQFYRNLRLRIWWTTLLHEKYVMEKSLAILNIAYAASVNTSEIFCCFSTGLRFFGGFLGSFSWTMQNLVGIDPGFTLAREEPGFLVKHSALKWSPHTLECSFTGVFVRRIFARHLDSNYLFCSAKRCQDFLTSMPEEFVP